MLQRSQNYLVGLELVASRQPRNFSRFRPRLTTRSATRSKPGFRRPYTYLVIVYKSVEGIRFRVLHCTVLVLNSCLSLLPSCIPRTSCLVHTPFSHLRLHPSSFLPVHPAPHPPPSRLTRSVSPLTRPGRVVDFCFLSGKVIPAHFHTKEAPRGHRRPRGGTSGDRHPASSSSCESSCVLSRLLGRPPAGAHDTTQSRPFPRLF